MRNFANSGIRYLRSRATLLAAVVTLAAGAASACGAKGGSDLPAGVGTRLGAGQVGTRAQVPWRSVGPGWALAEYSASTVPGMIPAKGGPAALYLVDPGGGRYVLYRWPNHGSRQPPPVLVDWSGDKARALFMQPEQSSSWQLVQITLTTGAVSTVTLPSDEMVTGYTRPDGLNILATRGVQQTEIVRLNLHGQLQAVLARGQNLTAVQSPDGITLAVSATGGLTLVSNAGGVIRRLPVPGDAGASGCTPVRWWNASTILAACGGGASRLWLIPAGGGAATALTAQPGSQLGYPFGDVGAWRLPSGLYVQAAGACGSLFIAAQAADRSLRVINIPGTVGNNNRIVTAYGSRLLVQAQTGCPGSNSLVWFNPQTRAVQMLLKAPNDVIGAFAEVPYSRLGG